MSILYLLLFYSPVTFCQLYAEGHRKTQVTFVGAIKSCLNASVVLSFFMETSANPALVRRQTGCSFSCAASPQPGSLEYEDSGCDSVEALCLLSQMSWLHDGGKGYCVQDYTMKNQLKYFKIINIRISQIHFKQCSSLCIYKEQHQSGYDFLFLEKKSMCLWGFISVTYFIGVKRIKQEYKKMS